MATYVISIPVVIEGQEVKYTFANYDNETAAIAGFKLKVAEQYPDLVVNDHEIVLEY